MYTNLIVGSSAAFKKNAPAQGILPWFYNEILPLGEAGVLSGVKRYLYDPFVAGMGSTVEMDSSADAVPMVCSSNDATFMSNSNR